MTKYRRKYSVRIFRRSSDEFAEIDFRQIFVGISSKNPDRFFSVGFSVGIFRRDFPCFLVVRVFLAHKFTGLAGWDVAGLGFFGMGQNESCGIIRTRVSFSSFLVSPEKNERESEKKTIPCDFGREREMNSGDDGSSSDGVPVYTSSEIM